MGWLLVGSLSWADAPRVEIRSNEVWVVRDGQERQLTNDGRVKGEVVLSSGGDRVVYYELCAQGQGCLPSVVVLDLDGQRLESFHLTTAIGGASGDCNSVFGISWFRQDSVILGECHINPSLSELVGVEWKTGKTVMDLFGFWFTVSPDDTRIAHVGWIPHFAGPPAKSYSLMVDDAIVYPHSDVKTVKTGSTGGTSSGIHEFVQNLVWSPDGKRVALVDCIFDWVFQGTDWRFGEERNRVCSLVVVAMDGKFQRFGLGGLTNDELRTSAKIEWRADGRVALVAPVVREFGVLP